MIRQINILLFSLILFSFTFSFGIDCFEEAGIRYNINPKILKAIAKKESSFNPYAVNINKNGSYDIGIMQINSWWIPKIRKYGYKAEDLYNPCLNIYIGSWILAQCIKEHGYNWKAIDCYNKGSKKAKSNSSYVKDIFSYIYDLNKPYSLYP